MQRGLSVFIFSKSFSNSSFVCTALAIELLFFLFIASANTIFVILGSNSSLTTKMGATNTLSAIEREVTKSSKRNFVLLCWWASKTQNISLSGYLLLRAFRDALISVGW